MFDIVKLVFPTAYISLEWALHYHEILDQYIHTVTLVWLKKPRTIQNKYRFEIHKISDKLYFGFDKMKRIAEPEKALLDTVYIRGSIPLELNIEWLDINKLKKYSKKYPKRVQHFVRENIINPL